MGLVLIVDDDADAADMLATLIAAEGFKVAVAPSLAEAKKQLALREPCLVLLDLNLPDGSGLSLFSEESLLNNAQVVLITGHATLETSIEALRLGAADYLVKPVHPDQLRGVLGRVVRPNMLAAELETWREQLAREGRFGQHLVGRSEQMQHVYQQIARVAATSVSVFIVGESGTGKELVAQTVHGLSRRRGQAFLAVNCGAISPHLMESEIFGHEKGSFTGADRQHQGFFERAHGGTLFLDEVTEMPLELQVKLLRVLETGSFMRVGSSVARSTDVRIIAATNRDPLAAVQAGTLREDLLYRLNVFPIVLPPLREHPEDIELLCTHFLQAIAQKEGVLRQLTPAALQKLQAYRWPGNVRELRNAMQRAHVMAEGLFITDEWLPTNRPEDLAAGQGDAGVGVGANAGAGTGAGSLDDGFLPGTSLADAEQQLILRTLQHFDNHKERTAAALGISLKTLYNKLKGYEASESLPEK